MTAFIQTIFDAGWSSFIRIKEAIRCSSRGWIPPFLANLSCLSVWTWEQPLNLCLCHTLSCVAAFKAPLRLIGIFYELQLIWSDWNFAVLGFEAFGEKYGRIFDSWGVVVQMKSDDSCNFFPHRGLYTLRHSMQRANWDNKDIMETFFSVLLTKM